MLPLLQVNQARAESMCNDIGGHLAAYVSQDEQVEMENAFLNSGYLLPSFHKTYWMGLVSNTDAWPTFTWLDRNVQNPSESGAYKHWGTYKFEGYRCAVSRAWWQAVLGSAACTYASQPCPVAGTISLTAWTPWTHTSAASAMQLARAQQRRLPRELRCGQLHRGVWQPPRLGLGRCQLLQREGGRGLQEAT